MLSTNRIPGSQAGKGFDDQSPTFPGDTGQFQHNLVSASLLTPPAARFNHSLQSQGKRGRR